MSSKANDSLTPRSLIQSIIDDQSYDVEHTTRVTRHQWSLLNASTSSRPSRKRSLSESKQSSAKKTGHAAKSSSRLSTSMTETTPRTLIGNFMGSQDSEKTMKIEPRVTRTPRSSSSPTRSTKRRQSRRQSLLKQATTRSLHQSMNDTTDETTPRTLIRNMLQHGEVETPAVPVRQRKKSIQSEAPVKDPMDVIEELPLRSSQMSVSSLEDSFVNVYSQPERTRRLRRSQRANRSLIQMSQEDFSTGVQERLSQDRSRRLASRSQLRDISELAELQNLSKSGNLSMSLTTVAEVHADDVRTSSDEDNLAKSASQDSQDTDQQEILLKINTEEENETETTQDEEEKIETETEETLAEKDAEEDGESDSDVSDDFTQTSSTSYRPNLSLGDQNETLGRGALTQGTRLGAIVSALSSSIQQQTTKDDLQEDKSSDEVAAPDHLDGNAEDLMEDIDVGNLSNTSAVPPSEAEDETDTREGLPGFNRTFSDRGSTSSRHWMDSFTGYSAMQTPVIQATDHHAPTPDIPAPFTHRQPVTPAEHSVQKKLQPLKVTDKQKKAPMKKSPKAANPSIPTSNTFSIFKHFTTQRVSKDALQEVEKVAAEYWRNLVDDVGAYADHAGRSTVSEADMSLLMIRQRLTSKQQSMYTLVEKFFPLEHQMEIIDVAQSGNKIYPK